MFWFGDAEYFNGDARESGLDFKHHAFFPAVIVRPSSADQVAAVLKFASTHRISVSTHLSVFVGKRMRPRCCSLRTVTATMAE